MSTRVRMAVQSRQSDRWFEVASLGLYEAIDALDGRGPHARAVEVDDERLSLVVEEGEWTSDPLSREGFFRWYDARMNDNTNEDDMNRMTCTNCDESGAPENFGFDENTGLHNCRVCGALAGFPWTGEVASDTDLPLPPVESRAPTRRERPATRFEAPAPERTFEATWANLDREADRPVWGARVVVRDGEDVPEGATLIVSNRAGTKQARKTAGETVSRFRDRGTGEFIRLVRVD